MKALRILIADDEYFAREVIKTFLEGNELVESIEEASTGLEAVTKIQELKPDLLFLDMQMPELSGMDVLHQVGGGYKPCVIFTTAHDQYAVKAFEHKAVDYLLKPFDRTRFEEAFSRACDSIQSRENDFSQLIKKIRGSFDHLQQTNNDNDGHLGRILIKETKRFFFVKTSDVYWFEASGDYVVVHLEKKSHLLSQSLNMLETHLNNKDFVRIHRSYIVNVNYIAEFEPHFNSEYFITLKNNARLKLSRTYRDQLDFLFTDLFDK